MKKLFAVLLAVAMLLSLGVTAFASGVTTGRIVILDPPAGTDGDSYKAYKIFDAVVGADNKVVYYASADWAGILFNIDDVTSAATTVDNPALYGLKFVLDATDDTRYQVVKSTGFDAERFATYMSDKVTPDVTFTKDPDTDDIYADVEPGYYLVESTRPDSLALTTVLPGKTVKVQNKKDMPLEKDVEVDGDDDYTDNNTGVSVGDELKYKITTKVPTDISADADTYTFVISDTMTDGLTFGDTLTITIGAVVYEIVYHPATGHTTATQAYIEVTQSGTAGNADVAAQIAALVAEIADLETQITAAQANIEADETNVTTAQGNVTAAQTALTAAQTKLAAMEAAMIANTYPTEEIDGKTYNSAAELLADLGSATAEPATGQYKVVQDAQAALTTAQSNLTAAQTTHQGLVDAKAALEAQKATKQAQITALQNAVSGENVETFTLVDNATDLLSGDQVRFYENGKTFELSIDMKSRSAQADTPVTIEYTATVNENAVAEILQNAAVLAFGNDSDIDYRDAETDNYTSQLIIDKFETGNRSQKLAGAEFKLKATDGENADKYYKLTGKPVQEDGGTADGLMHDATFPEKLVYGTRVDIPVVVFVADKNGKLQVAVLEDGAPDDNGNYNPKTSAGDETTSTLFYGDVKVEWVDEAGASKVVTDAEGRGVFGYLPDGSYELIETVAPVDYIKLTDPIEITIDGHRAVDKSLEKAERIAALTNAANVENTPGSSLPSTGGVGATLLTIGGVALMLAAGAFLVLRRRKEQE